VLLAKLQTIGKPMSENEISVLEVSTENGKETVSAQFFDHSIQNEFLIAFDF
jgi:hypothetical protein